MFIQVRVRLGNKTKKAFGETADVSFGEQIHLLPFIKCDKTE
jgi:hypothetical protein